MVVRVYESKVLGMESKKGGICEVLHSTTNKQTDKQMKERTITMKIRLFYRTRSFDL
jgi:hypothetical protein